MAIMNEVKVGDMEKSDLVTVRPMTKIEAVAKVFDEKRINAAPVVDSMGKCIGVITSYDLVQYEANRIECNSQSMSGRTFELTPGNEGQPNRLVGRQFDEVAYHMTANFGTVSCDELLSDAGRLMCQKHLHYLINLDSAGRPVGILSSLDVIGELLQEPVQRINRQKLIDEQTHR